MNYNSNLLKNNKNTYNWIYTTSNDNIYILLLVIIILGFIIIDFGLFRKKTDKIYKTDNSDNSDNFYDVQNNISTTIPNTTLYQAPTVDNLMNPNFYISKEEIERRNAWSQLDGNEESLYNTNGTNFGSTLFRNDITQLNSTLFNNSNSSNSSVQARNYATIGDYATLDTLGSTLTDTLGGIKFDRGYTILKDQLGTFNNYSNNNNPHTYDNTANFKTGMNSSTVDGAITGSLSGKGSGFSGEFIQDNKPIFLQKDFQGVANIFAPNIIISNPPLNSDGNPDISFQM